MEGKSKKIISTIIQHRTTLIKYLFLTPGLIIIPLFAIFLYRYLMYVAESIPDPQQQFFYEGSALSTSPVIGVRPIIIIYHVNSQKFQTVTQIPAHFSPGNLIWKPDSSGVVGNYQIFFMNLC